MRKKGTILYVDHSLVLGGASRILVHYAGKLESFGEPMVVCPPASPLVTLFVQQGISILPFEMPWFMKTAGLRTLISYPAALVRFALFLTKTIRGKHAVLIHANTFITALYCALPARFTGIPLVWHMHDILEPGLINRLFIRYAAWGARRIICVSDAVRRHLVEFGVNVEKCRVIRNCIIDPSSKEETAGSDFRQENGITDDVLLVGAFGNLSELKGQHVLIEVAARLAAKFPEVRYVIVGDAIVARDQRYRQRLHDDVARYGLVGRVLFTGYRTDVPSILAEMDVVVHVPTLPDSLPTVILEAMQAGKPVVASRIGGIPEIIADGVNGLLVEPGNAEALAESLSRLLLHPEARRRMGHEGRRILKERFSEEVFLESRRGIYHELLKGTSP